MVENLIINYKRKKNFFILFFTLLSLGIVTLFYLEYRQSSLRFNEYIDKTLSSAVYDAKMVLGEDFFKRAVTPDAISKSQDRNNIRRLSELVKNNHVSYIYSFYFKNSQIHFTSSSAMEEDFKNHEATHYWDVYEEATPRLKNIFKDFKPFFEISTDRWGTFKSLLVPFKEGNTTYVIGANIRLDTIVQHQRQITIKYLVFAFLTLSGLIVLWVEWACPISRPKSRIKGQDWGFI